jgi:hypothetical protein
MLRKNATKKNIESSLLILKERATRLQISLSQSSNGYELESGYEFLGKLESEIFELEERLENIN